jgi:SAM-dependent methyltransferase
MIGRNSPEQPDAPPLIDEERVDRTTSSAEVSEEPSATAPRYSSSRPDLESFERFLDDVKASFPEKEYRWTKGKSRSSKWILDRVPAGWRGVDVGGTEYLCKKLAEKGCKATFFDIGAPEDYGDYIQDDMINILRHFEEKSLDFITTRHTLEHSLMPLFQLWAYNRLLKDDGRLFVIVPIHNERWVWYPTHFNCLPYENWLMLFYRAGFKVEEHDAGTWSVTRPDFIEYRFSLSVQSRELRLAKGRR